MPTYIRKPEYIIAFQFDGTKSCALNILNECPGLLTLSSSYNPSEDYFDNWKIETRPDLPPPYTGKIVNKGDYICNIPGISHYSILSESEFEQRYDKFISSQLGICK